MTNELYDTRDKKLKMQMKALQDNYIQCLSDETSMTKRQIQTLINRKVNVYLSAEEAIEKGLADEVLK